MHIKSLTENTIVNRKRTKRQTMIHKTPGRQKRMKNTNPTKYWGWTQVLRKVRQNIDSSSRLYNGNLIGTTSIRKSLQLYMQVLLECCYTLSLVWPIFVWSTIR